MSERLYELKARINTNGSIALEARDLFTLPGGREIEGDPRPVQPSDADVAAFVSSFNADAIAETAAKAAAIADLQQQLATLTIERDQLTAERDQLAANVTNKSETIAALQAEIEALKNPPANPRRFEPRPFANAFFTAEQQVAIFLSTDPRVVYARGQMTLARYVDLDDPDTASMLQLLAAAGVVTMERVQEILDTGKAAT